MADNNNFRIKNGLEVGDVTVIDSSRNFTAAQSIKVNDIAPSNSIPAINDVELSGYGLIGNRTNIYITNANSTGSGRIILGIGNSHNTNPKLTVTASGIIVAGTISSSTISADNFVTTGQLRGPATFVIDPAAHGDDTGTVVIAGNLQIDGLTTTINSTTLTVDDKNIVLASGSINAAAANTAGITVDGANAKLTYNSTDDSWDINKRTKIQGPSLGGTLGNTATLLSVDGGRGHIDFKEVRTANQTDWNSSTYKLQHRIDTTEMGSIDFVVDASYGRHIDIVTQGFNSRFTANGRLGIGTISPERALHVVGGIHLPNNNIISWDQADGTLRNAIYVDSGDDMIIGDTNFDDIYFSTGQKTKTVVIKQTTGNVGIGTSSPSELLTVAGDSQFATPTVLITDTDASVQLNQVVGKFAVSVTDGSAPGTGVKTSIQTVALNSIGGHYGMTFHTTNNDGNDTERMRIDASGNTTITAAGNPTLTVKGNAGAYSSFLVLQAAAGGGSTINATGATSSYLNFQIDGSNKMTIDSAGNVGIGTSSPNTLMEIASTSPVLRITNTTNSSWSAGDDIGRLSFYSNDASAVGPHETAFILNESDFGSGITQLSGALSFGTAAYNAAATERMRIDSSGTVQFKGGTTDNAIQIWENNSEIARIGGSSGKLNFLVGSITASRMTIDSAGNVGIGTSSPNFIFHAKSTSPKIAAGSTIAMEATNDTELGGFVFNTHYNLQERTGMYAVGNYSTSAYQPDLTFKTNSTRRLTILGNGDVGIGTTNPVAKLHIQGSGNFNHTPGQNTTSDFVITSSEMTDNNAHSIMQLVSVRQSLSTGNGSTGYLGFSTMDDSNGQGIRDAGRIAIVNEVGTSRNSPTALSFWTNAGGTDTTAATEKLRITSSGNVGIGESDPQVSLHLSGVDSQYMLFRTKATSVTAGTVTGGLLFMNGDHSTPSGDRVSAAIKAVASDAFGRQNLVFSTSHINSKTVYAGAAEYVDATIERMRIDSAGNVGIGVTPSEILHIESATTSPAILVKAAAQTGNTTTTAELILANGSLSSNDSAPKVIAYRTADYSTAALRSSGLKFQTTNANAPVTAMTLNNSGNVGIGTSSPPGKLTISNNGAEGIEFFPANLSGLNTTQHYNRSGSAYVVNKVIASEHRFNIGTSEKVRINTLGQLLVNKTASSTGTAGVELQSGTGAFSAVVATATAQPLLLNKLSAEGSIAVFRKDNTNAGQINVHGTATDSYISMGNKAAGLQYVSYQQAQYIRPFNVLSNLPNDNSLDLGQSNARFDDVYATNGTIQTSDRNEKQDIEELSDAETRVAVACKGLLRKFRWKDSVDEKGDEARTHFGIIAQDLQDAFSSEGLDASDYAMFISTTWTDEETDEEMTRLGVRYSELLAFIIAAL